MDLITSFSTGATVDDTLLFGRSRRVHAATIYPQQSRLLLNNRLLRIGLRCDEGLSSPLVDKRSVGSLIRATKLRDRTRGVRDSDNAFLASGLLFPASAMSR